MYSYACPHSLHILIRIPIRIHIFGHHVIQKLRSGAHEIAENLYHYAAQQYYNDYDNGEYGYYGEYDDDYYYDEYDDQYQEGFQGMMVTWNTVLCL